MHTRSGEGLPYGVIAICIGGFGLRSFRIQDYLLQVDAGNKLNRVGLSMPLNLDWMRMQGGLLFSDPHSAFPRLLIKILVDIFSLPPDLSIRLLSVVFGALTIPAVYYVISDRRIEAILAAGFLAVLPYHVYYSRMNWYEISMTFFFTLYVAILWTALTEADSKFRFREIGLPRSLLLFVLSGLVLVLGYLFHPMLILVLPATFLIVAYCTWQERTFSTLTYFSGSLLPLLVYYSIFPLHVIASQPSGDNYTSSPTTFLLEHAGIFVDNVSLILTADYRLWEFFTAPVVALALLGVAFAIYRSDRKMLYLAFLGISYACTVLFIWEAGFKPRFQLPVVPLVVCLASFGLVQTARLLPRERRFTVDSPRGVSYIAGALLVAFLLVFTVQSLFVTDPVGPHSPYLQQTYAVTYDAPNMIERVLIEDSCVDGTAKVYLYGGAELQYHLYESGVEFADTVDPLKPPDYILIKPWVKDSFGHVELIKERYELVQRVPHWDLYGYEDRC